MVDMFTHTVNMGVGDVAMGFFVGEADDKPTGGICFRDIDPAPIQILPDDYDVSFNPDEFYSPNPKTNITLSFSSPESIDSVISVLNYVKKIAFQDESKRKEFMEAKQIFKGTSKESEQSKKDKISTK